MSQTHAGAREGGACDPFGAPPSTACSLTTWVSLIPFRIEDEKIGVRVVDRLGRPTITHSECEYQRSQCKCRSEALTGSLLLSHSFLPVGQQKECRSSDKETVKLASKDGRLVMCSARRRRCCPLAVTDVGHRPCRAGRCRVLRLAEACMPVKAFFD